MNRKYFLLSLLIGMSLILGLSLFTQSSKGTIQNPDFLTWKENIYYENENSSGIIPDYDYNIRNKEYFTENYKATFDFRNDIGKINDSIPFISLVDYGAYAEVVENIDNHSSVVYLHTSIVDQNIWCNLNFYDTIGSVEFWLMKNITTDVTGFGLLNDLTPIIQCYLHSNNHYQYLDDSLPYLTDTGFDYQANVWSHHRIDWYDDNTFDWYVNGYKIVDGMNAFGTMVNGINRVKFYTTTDSCYYLDAFGIADAVYDGIDDYDNNDNIFPEKVILDDLEVDKFEFDEYNYDGFENNDFMFTQVESTPYLNEIFLSEIDDLDSNIIYNHIPDGSTSTSYIDSDIGITDKIVNFTMNLNLKKHPSAYHFAIFLYPYDCIPGGYIKLLITNSHELDVKDMLYDSDITVGTITVDTDISINCYLNFNDYLGYIYESSSGNSLIFNLNDGSSLSGHYGLESMKIVITQTLITDEAYTEFQNFGFYGNGTSFKNRTENFGILSYDTYFSAPIKRYNLLSIEINQDFELYNYNTLDSFFLNGNKFLVRDNYTDLVKYNLVNNFDELSSKLIFVVYDNVEYPTFIKIEGIYYFADSNNSFPTTYTYINSDSTINYFYVVNNRLYFTFNNSETEISPEFMRVRFSNVDYFIQENYSIGFNSYITGNYSGYMRFRYDDETNDYFYFNKSDCFCYSEYSLPFGKTLSNIMIEISIDDYDTAEGITEGYIEYILIGHSYDVFDDILDNLDDSILDLEFLEGLVFVIIILIFFIVPCYLVYERFGKKVVIPMFILIVIVLMISTFLPIWLSLILLVSSFLFLYHKSKRDDFND